MGTFKVTIQVGDPQGTRYESIEALADTGASHTVVAADVLERLGVAREEQWPFELADGRIIDRDVGQTRVRLDGREVTTVVVFGRPGEAPLLGAHALEGARLASDPVRQRLIRVPGLLK
jgi:clan AA aspartic protease